MNISIYVRVSTVEQVQEGYSISAQISLLRDYAKALGHNIVKIYQDAGISGKNISDRPALKELIKDVENKSFEMVLVWKLSRLSRSLLDLLSIVNIFTKHGISFQSYSEKFDTSTPLGKMLLQLLGSIAEFERNTIVENVKMGLGERFKQGHSKGAIPFGYRNEDKKAIVVPEQADMVKKAFQYYIDNPTHRCLADIADEFNGKGFRTRTNGLWTRHTIKELLMNKFYAGYVRTGVQSHGRKKEGYSELIGEHESLISLDMYEKVQQKIIRYKTTPNIKNEDNECFLTGLIECPMCGKKLYALNSHNVYKAKSGQKNIYTIKGYRCISATKSRVLCKGFTIAASKVEPDALKMLIDFSQDDLKKAKDIAASTQVPNNKNELKNVEFELKKAYSLRDKYFKLFESDKVDMNMFADKINNILANIAALEIRRDEELIKKTDVSFEGVMEFIKNLQSLTGAFENLTNSQKKDFARRFIKNICLKNRTVEKVELTNGIFLYHE
jgi:site-specific DNA recombinase